MRHAQLRRRGALKSGHLAAKHELLRLQHLLEGSQQFLMQGLVLALQVQHRDGHRAKAAPGVWYWRHRLAGSKRASAQTKSQCLTHLKCYQPWSWASHCVVGPAPIHISGLKTETAASRGVEKDRKPL